MKALKISLMNGGKEFSVLVHNGPSFVVCPIVCQLVELFLYTLKRLSSSLSTKGETVSGENNSSFIGYRENFLEKYSKTSSKRYKHLVQ